MPVAVAFVQEYKTEQSLKALEKLSPFYARVQRSGQLLSIQASQLVPGDIVYIESGDRIPADLRLLECNGLSVDESSFTGENKPVYKNPETPQNVENLLDLSKFRSWSFQLSHLTFPNLPKIPLAERLNVCYMGTLVSSGNGKGLVIAIGKDTEFGQICDMMKEVCFYILLK
jgi:Ca2+-transporting ATPase